MAEKPKRPDGMSEREWQLHIKAVEAENTEKLAKNPQFRADRSMLINTRLAEQRAAAARRKFNKAQNKKSSLGSPLANALALVGLAFTAAVWLGRKKTSPNRTSITGRTAGRLGVNRGRQQHRSR